MQRHVQQRHQLPRPPAPQPGRQHAATTSSSSSSRNPPQPTVGPGPQHDATTTTTTTTTSKNLPAAPMMALVPEVSLLRFFLFNGKNYVSHVHMQQCGIWRQQNAADATLLIVFSYAGACLSFLNRNRTKPPNAGVLDGQASNVAIVQIAAKKESALANQVSQWHACTHVNSTRATLFFCVLLLLLLSHFNVTVQLTTLTGPPIFFSACTLSVGCYKSRNQCTPCCRCGRR